MAIWCEVPSSTHNSSLETHLNYWRVADQQRPGCTANEEDFLEVGLLITNPNSVSAINIFLPLVVSVQKVTDIGSKFSNRDIAQGIFNESLTLTSPSSGNGWIDLNLQGSTPLCRVHSFARAPNGLIDSSEMQVTQQDGGTLICITANAIAASTISSSNQTRLYFRIRVLVGKKDNSPFVKVIKPADKNLQSGFDEIEYIDFRLNESRSLPDNVERTIRRDAVRGTVPMSLVAFLAAVPVASELSVSHTAIHKNRLLEHIPWTDYAPQPLPDGMMVYHWKKEEIDIASFTAFVKLQTRKAGSTTITHYLVIAFLFGILGNLAASGLEKLAGLMFGWH
ncbi:hypothetical protein [Methylobacterium bullatum]